MRFLGHSDFKNDFKKSHFKFLGRWIHSSLNEQVIKDKVRSEFLEAMKTVSESRVRGFKKLWLYQHYVLARFSWPLMIHDFDLSYAKGIDRLVIPMLKKWSGVERSVDTGLLFRSRHNFGLGLTAVSDHFQAM